MDKQLRVVELINALKRECAYIYIYNYIICTNAHIFSRQIISI